MVKRGVCLLDVGYGEAQSIQIGSYQLEVTRVLLTKGKDVPFDLSHQ